MLTRNDSQTPQPVEWTPELVGKFWDGLAQAGLGDTLVFGAMAKRCIHWLLARHFVLGGRHLDYGAGGGEVAAHLIEKGFPFAIFEPSNERQQKTEAVLSGRDGFLGKLGDTPSGAFDVVTCFEVLEHVLEQDFDTVCDQLAAHVRPGGKLVISTPNNENLSLNMVYCPISNRYFHRWQHVRSVSPDWLEEVFAQRGIEKICTHQLDFSEALYEPYLHLMGFPATEAASDSEVFPLHIHNIINDIDVICGGAAQLLFIGRKKD